MLEGAENEISGAMATRAIDPSYAWEFSACPCSCGGTKTWPRRRRVQYERSSQAWPWHPIATLKSYTPSISHSRSSSVFFPNLVLLSAILPLYTRALLTAGAMGTACAVLSVIIVLRRWAFIGEGIAHAGFGGIGTGWLLSLAFPLFAHTSAVYAVAVLFCLVVSLCI